MNRNPTFTIGGMLLLIAMIALLSVGYDHYLPQLKIRHDALERVERSGQRIVDAAFPASIGAVPFQRVAMEGVYVQSDGYRALVNIHYTNIIDDKNCMTLELTYDSDSAFVDAAIYKCNDRWASPVRLVDLAGVK